MYDHRRIPVADRSRIQLEYAAGHGFPVVLDEFCEAGSPPSLADGQTLEQSLRGRTL